MIVIRANQQMAFETIGRKRFEDEMVDHSRLFSPRLCEVIGYEQHRLAVRSAVTRAEAYGFTNRGPIRLFIELTFLCGSSFDTDPQYAAISEALRGAGDQMWRAQRIHEEHNVYIDSVSGPRAVNVHNALRDTLILARSSEVFLGDFGQVMLDGMRRIFPQKAAYAGDSGLQALVAEAIAEARQHNFDKARHVALLAILRFAFGHGCTNDLLYPWIAQTLQDQRIVSPAGRAERLERKSIIWLEHVVTRNEGTVQA